MISYSVEMNHLRIVWYKVLKKIFKVRTHENRNFKFWVLNVKQSKDGIIINQNQYATSISLIEIKKERPLRKNKKLSPDEKTELKMMCVSTQTYPDVSFDVYRIRNILKWRCSSRPISHYKNWNLRKVLYLVLLMPPMLA